LNPELLEYLTRFRPLNAAEAQAFASCCQRMELPRSALLCRPGDVCRRLFFVHSGVVRSSYLLKDRDVTAWLAFRGDAIASYSSMTRGAPAEESLEVLETASLTALDYPALLQRAQKEPGLLELALRMTEHFFIRMEERLFTLQCTTAEDRLRILLEAEPDVLERVSQTHVASYLGMAPETLSRARTKLFRPAPDSGSKTQ
jgi:CRP/FNR family transcriptional regulator, anaerobic regulatory protein